MQLYRMIEKRISEIEKAISYAERLKRESPDGYLAVRKIRGVTHFIKVYFDEEGHRHEKYIKDENLNLKKVYANKRYAIMILPVLKREISVLKQVKREYRPMAKYGTYMRLPQDIRGYASPIFLSPSDMYKRWAAEKYEPSDRYREHLRFETARGEMVRSKGELYIADRLAEYPDVLDYRYEKPTRFSNGTEICTDFEIFNKRTGRIRRWEHCGMMDKPEYLEDYIWKYNNYTKAGFMPGNDIIYTFETKMHPMDTGVIRRIIRRLAEDGE